MRVLVTGATRNSGLAVMRALARGGMRPLGADDRTLPFGLRSRYSEPYRRYPSVEDESFADGLEALLREARPDAFLPLASWIISRVVRERDRFASIVPMNLPDPNAFDAVFDARRLAAACAVTGVACPELYSREEASDRFRRGETVVVKPAEDWGGARGVSYCGDEHSLGGAFDAISSAYGDPIAQEYVPGGAGAMRTATLVFDRDGSLLASFTTRKIRAMPPTGGVTAMCISTDDTLLVDALLPLFEHLRWRGPAEAELKVDARDGRAKLIEVNPRFPGYVGFSVACGINLPRVAAMAAGGRGREVARRPSYRAGVRYLAASPFLRSVIAEAHVAGMPRALSAALREWRPNTAGNSRDWSDPGPRVGKLLHELRRLVGAGAAPEQGPQA